MITPTSNPGGINESQQFNNQPIPAHPALTFSQHVQRLASVAKGSAPTSPTDVLHSASQLAASGTGPVTADETNHKYGA